MGKELEYKLKVPDETALSLILSDPDICALQHDGWQERWMNSTYYDAADRRFSSQRWTFRHRMEGDISIVCLKTPTEESHTRGEWQVAADGINESSIQALLDVGAPKELEFLYASGDIEPICGAKFLRKSCMLHFPDGSTAEIAGDHGKLYGKNESTVFTELELELYEGKPDKMIELLALLMKRYQLKEQGLSKFSRARMLK